QNVETYGDVPYRDANNILEIAQPKYDTQEFIFKDLLKQLKKANDDLKGTKGWTKGDIIFNGDVDKWRKFANSLRLRIAMRISNVDPAFSKAEAAAAIADGVMESNADNAAFHFIGPGTPNQAPLYSDYESRFDFTPTWQFTNMLLGNDDKGKGFVNPFNGIIDPRLKQIAVAPMNQDSKTYNTEGMPYGLDDDMNAAVWDVIKDKAIYYGPTKGKSDEELQKPIQSKFWSTLMDYTNVVLFQAELNNNDRSLFQKGVEASLATWRARCRKNGICQ
ncbi:MAG: SusD/RagB family nutrient-binding outer membrane lipoprotein, partial [Rikenellaceae bacterium]